MTDATSPTSMFLIPTDTPGVFDLEFDNTTKELFETCNRAALYYKVLRRELDSERAALFAGGVLHEALALRMMNTPDWERKQQTLIVDAYVTNPVSFEEWRNADMLCDTITGYNRTYPLDKEPFRVLPDPDTLYPMVEKPFRLLLGTVEINGTLQLPGQQPLEVQRINCYFTGRIDALVDFDVPMVLDHKTTSMEGETFYDDFLLSGQMMGYTWAARALGFPAQGLVLDAICWRKPTKTGKGTTYKRQRYFYSDAQIEEWRQDTIAHIVDFLEHCRHGYFPKTTKWCFGKYGRCQYHCVCTQQPDQRDSILESTLFRDVTWSPLN